MTAFFIQVQDGSRLFKVVQDGSRSFKDQRSMFKMELWARLDPFTTWGQFKVQGLAFS